MDRNNRRPHAATTPFALVLMASAAGAALAACGSSRFGDREVEGDVPASVSEFGVSGVSVDLPGRVSAVFRVMNANGTPAADLTGADFNIYEDGDLVSKSESFQQLRPLPQEFRSFLHLILDRSNSVQSAMGTPVQDGAHRFIDDVVTQDSSNYVKISWFDGSAGLYPIAGHDIGFSNNSAALHSAIDALNAEPPFSTSTNLYGAVLRGLNGLDEANSAAMGQGVQNRALTLVTFTDGTHQAGGQVTLGQVVTRIVGGPPTGGEYNAFTIGVGQEIDPSVLVALGPNGSVAEEDFGLLEEAFGNIGRQVRDLSNSVYNLSYCSPKTSGLYTLTISVLETPTPGQDFTAEFDAAHFGAGCAFLDVVRHGELGDQTANVHVTDVVETADGKVVVVGWRSDDCSGPGCPGANSGSGVASSSAFVARFLTSPAALAPGETVLDGQLDTSFGSGGVVVLDEPGLAISGATSIAVEGGTNALLVGGWAQAAIQLEPSQATIWRLNAAGSTATRTTLPNPSAQHQVIMDLVRDGSGSIYAAGFAGIGSRISVVWKLLPSLALDAGFGAGGRYVAQPTPVFGNEGFGSVVFGSMNRLYAVGRNANRIEVSAINRTSGALDPTFGMDGVATPRSSFGAIDVGTASGGAILDGQGRLLIAGTLTSPLTPGAVGEQPAIWRLLETGAADPSFVGSLSSPTYGTGVVTLREGSTNNVETDFGLPTRLEGLTLAPNGTILATGYRENGMGDTDTIILAFDQEGVSDGDFNFVGFIIDDGAGGDDSFDRGSAIHVLNSGAVWTFGVSHARASGPGSVMGDAGVPIVWVDRDPQRVFAPLGPN